MELTSGLARRQNRPGNDNPILDYVRDEYYKGCDVWGLATTWQFAIADHLTRFDAVPEEWNFTPSPFGADVAAPEYVGIQEALAQVDEEQQLQYLTHAGRVLEHLTRQAHAAIWT